VRIVRAIIEPIGDRAESHIKIKIEINPAAIATIRTDFTITIDADERFSRYLNMLYFILYNII
jgi:hypothetical protein